MSKCFNWYALKTKLKTGLLKKLPDPLFALYYKWCVVIFSTEYAGHRFLLSLKVIKTQKKTHWNRTITNIKHFI